MQHIVPVGDIHVFLHRFVWKAILSSWRLVIRWRPLTLLMDWLVSGWSPCIYRPLALYAPSCCTVEASVDTIYHIVLLTRSTHHVTHKWFCKINGSTTSFQFRLSLTQPLQAAVIQMQFLSTLFLTSRYHLVLRTRLKLY